MEATVKFEVGKTYYCRCIRDSSLIYYYTVDRRTEKSVFITDEDGKYAGRKSIRIDTDGIEWVSPKGNHSMAPVLRANRETVQKKDVELPPVSNRLDTVENISEALIELEAASDSKDWARIETAVDNVFRFDAMHPAALCEMGNLCYERGEMDLAVDFYERMIAASPADATPYYNIANIMMKERKLATAIRYYLMALAIDPNFGDAFYNLALTCSVAGFHDRALRYFQRAAQVTDNDLIKRMASNKANLLEILISQKVYRADNGDFEKRLFGAS